MTGEQPDDIPDGITVQFTATLHYEPWEVHEYDITEQAAIENLLDGVRREPGNYGEVDVERTEPGEDN